MVLCEGSGEYARSLTRFLEHDGDIRVERVFAAAKDMVLALPRIDPDLIIMDLELPEVGGVASIERMMRHRPVPVLVLSEGEGSGSERAAEALGAGALEAIPKDRLRLLEPGDVWATATRSRVKRLGSVRLHRERLDLRRMVPACRPPFESPVRVVGIGVSTGGPPALGRVLGELPADFPLPVLVVQHIASGFGDGLIRLLARQCALPVRIAADGAVAEPGIWFAPDDCHLVLEPSLRFALDRKTSRGPHRPSVDMLFESLASSTGEATLGVVLTGMGRDGADGVEAIRAAGGHVIAQDERSSAVFGMPRAAIESGADIVSGLQEIGPTLRALRSAETVL